MVKHHKRAKEHAKVATGVLEALEGPAVLLPGVRADETEVAAVKWDEVDASQMFPYPTELEPGDDDGEYRRERMDNLVLGVMRYSQYSLSALAATLGMAKGDQLGYAVSTVSHWYEANIDGFRDRVRHAHSVLKGRLIFSVIDRADKPYVPREYFRDNIPLFAALNAFNPEHFKRGNNGVATDGKDSTVEIHKTLIMVGDQMAAEMKALAEGHR